MIKGRLSDIRVGDTSPVAIIGVINVSANSFYTGSVRKTPEQIGETARKMETEGASVIDVGARSTAPYRSSDISTSIETRLLGEAVKAVSKNVNIPISADTTRLQPAGVAIKEGATILNDVYGLTQKNAPELARLVAAKECSLIVTAHEPRMRTGLHDPIARVSDALAKSISLAQSEGVSDFQITVDPGIGFFSDTQVSNSEWNCTVLRRLSELREFNRPICVGVSRKKFIGILTGDKSAEERLFGSLSAAAIAVYNGAHVIRTHDVAETLDAVQVAAAIMKKEKSLSHEKRA